jgi:hypothetical protein
LQALLEALEVAHQKSFPLRGKFGCNYPTGAITNAGERAVKKNKKIRAVPPGAAAEADEVAVEFIPCTLENIAEIKAAKRDVPVKKKR